MAMEETSRDRPRERLELVGVEALSETDLIVLLLGSGHRNASARELALRLQRRYPTVGSLAEASPLELGRIPGIGPARRVV